MAARVDPLTVKCPVCAAKVGRPCQSVRPCSYRSLGRPVSTHPLRREHARLASPGVQTELELGGGS